ncbi:Tn3 family transposase [Nonomuraea diastatica]|uniref:Tn3 family transposase n=1 Tax=Nonomuraea diastatica TaxID=1848329 RepID=UPI0026B4DFD8
MTTRQIDVSAWAMGNQGAALDGVHINSDMVFGIFSMLGYRFAPRFADLGDQRF